MTGDTVPFPAPRAAAITTPTCLAQLVLGKPHPPGALWPCQAETGKGVAQGRQPHPAFLQTSEPRTKGRGCVQTKLDKNSPRPGTPGDRQYETLSVRSGPGHTGKPAGPGTGRHSLSGEGKPWAAGKALGTPPPARRPGRHSRGLCLRDSCPPCWRWPPPETPVPRRPGCPQ